MCLVSLSLSISSLRDALRAGQQDFSAHPAAALKAQLLAAGAVALLSFPCFLENLSTSPCNSSFEISTSTIGFLISEGSLLTFWMIC